jgi:hypothetical protein
MIILALGETIRSFLNRRWLAILLVILMRLPIRADLFSVVMQGTNGYHIPAIIGASGSTKGFTGFDYFEWFGINHHRYWFKPSFSLLNPTGGVTNVDGFNSATAAVRADPWRQGTSNDVYFDWKRFTGEFDTGGGSQNVGSSGPYTMQRLERLGITPMMVDTALTDQDPLADWGNKFMYWKQWYCYVYFFASQYGLTMYEFRNEPNASNGSYAQWESHWLVAADAMRKAMADVNANYGKNLTLYICGPTTPGPYWDYSLPDPTVDVHGWGSTSWSDIKTDIYGNIDPSIWNYGMYDYHTYSTDVSGTQSALTALRQGIATATNSPNSTIPLLISEYNTSDGANFTANGLDTEDITYGIGLAPMLLLTATLGPAGLGDQGGFFLFKLGAPGVTNVTSGIGNQTAYVSAVGDYNYGGVTRGGACFQLYAHHFRGGKPVLGYTVTSGASSQRRLAAVYDETNQAYYVYISNMNGVNATATLDLGALDVQPGAPVTVARVDTNNTGQVTDYLTVDATKHISFSAPNNTALLVWIPQGNAADAVSVQPPTNDTYLVVGETGTNHGTEPTMEVSLNHTIASQRRIGFLQFNFNNLTNGKRFLLKLVGHNLGTRPTAREILHVYGAGGGSWSETNLAWAAAPGVGWYYTGTNTMAPATGLGAMVDIEDNYEGVTSGIGQGLGLYGKFLGPVSFYSSAWTTNYVDVTAYVNSLIASNQTSATFVIAHIVRYNVNQYSNSTYYTQGVYDYDGETTEIGTKENPSPNLQPTLVVWQKGSGRN